MINSNSWHQFVPLSTEYEESNSVTESKQVRLFPWILFFVFTNVFPVWAVFYSSLSMESPKPLLIFTICFFTIHPFGALWMIVDSIRHRRRITWMVLFAAIPYAFLWYYIEVVKKRTDGTSALRNSQASNHS